MKYPDLSWGQLEAIVNKLGGYQAAKDFLRGKIVVSKKEKANYEITESEGCKVMGSFSVFSGYAKRYIEGLLGLFEQTDNFRRLRLRPIDSCQNVNRRSGEIVVRYFIPDKTMSTDQLLAAIDAADMRPTLYEEHLAFVEAFPEEQKWRWFVSFGSFVMVDGQRRCVSSLDPRCDSGKELRLDYMDRGDWLFRHQIFLVVNKLS